MATSYHMEALRRQRVIERAVAARLRMEKAQLDTISVEPPHSVSPSQSLANGVADTEIPKLSQQSNRSATDSVHTPSVTHTESRASNRTVSKHSSQRSRPSTAATLTKENVGEDTQVVSSRPTSHASRAVSAGSNKQQEIQESKSNHESKEPSRSEKREDVASVKSREGSKLSNRAVADDSERLGSAVSAEKPKSANLSQKSSKRNSPIPEEGAQAVDTNNKSSRPPSEARSTSHHSSRRPETHDKQTYT